MAGEDLGSVYYTVDADTKGVLKVKSDVDKTVNSVESGLKRVDTQMTKTAKGVKSGMAGFGRSAGQAGIQFQQFVGQVQGGTSALLALSQQAADVGIVLGAPLIGVIVSLGAALAMTLVPAAKEASKEVEILKIETIELGNAQRAWFAILASEALAQKNMELAKAVELQNKYKNFLENSRRAQDENSKATISAKRSYAEAQSEVERLTKEVTQYEEKLKELNGTTELTSAAVKSQRDSYKSLIGDLELQITMIGKNEREQAKLNATALLGKLATDEQIKSAHELIDTYYDQVDAIKAVENQLANQVAMEEAQLNEMLKLRKEYLAELDKENKRAQSVTGQVEGLADSSDPVRQLEAQREKQLAIVREYEQLETSEHQVAVDARKAIDDEYNSKLAAAQEARFVAQSESNALLIDGINALGDASASVLTGMLTQTLDLKSAMLGLANSILNSAVNAIIQMGIEYVKSALIGQSADQALAASQAATAAANAATHTAAVTAAVAELTSLAAAGAFAATAAIPIVGPAAAPAAAGAAAAATTALGAPAIAAAPVAGMRLYGGSAAPNSLYKVTEDGRPEMFSDGRDSFLMTGSRGGSVTSNGDLGGSGDQINIVVNNNAPNSKATASYDEQSKTVKIAINEIGKQFRENSGPAFDGLIAGTTANGRAT